MKSYPVLLCAFFTAVGAFSPVFHARRAISNTVLGEGEGEPTPADEPVAVAPPKKEEPYFSVLAGVALEDDAGGFSGAEKQRVVDNVFECHGFFPDLRSENQLPASVRKMREQPKSQSELSTIKKKYASMSQADSAFAVLCDLGMMENYDLLGDYSDDFDDYAIALVSVPRFHATMLPETKALQARGNEHQLETKPGILKRIQARAKSLKKSAITVAFASLAFRNPQRVLAATAAVVRPMSAVETKSTKSEDNVVGGRVVAVMAATGAGAAVAKYGIKRKQGNDGEESESSTDVVPAEVQGSKPTLEEKVTPNIDVVVDTKKEKEREIIAGVLEKVKEAEQKALERTRAALKTAIGEKKDSSDLATQKETKPSATVVAAILDPISPQVFKRESEFTDEEIASVSNRVFECHGFFPDLRTEEELPPEVRKMRQQPKSKSELVAIKRRYDAIPDESERVYTMLVDLGMMESYDDLGEYTDDFDDDEL